MSKRSIWGLAVLALSTASAVSQPAPTAMASPALSAVAGNTFRYCHNPVWRPFDFSDNGEHRGVFQDYLELFSQRLHIKVTVHPTSSWTGALDALRSGDCDFLVGAVKTPERESYSLFTRPYYNIDYVVLAKQDKPFTTSLESLAGQTIAATKSSAMMAHLNRSYPFIKTWPVETVDQAVEAISSGRVYGAVGALDEMVTDQHVALNNLKVIHKLDFPYPISVAVRKDLPDLHAAFQWAVDSLTSEDRMQIFRRWTPVTISQKVDYTLLLQVLGVGSVLLASFVVWNRRLKHEIQKRRQVEEQLNERGRDLEALNQRLQISLKAGRLSTWEWHLEGDALWWDDAGLAMLGYERTEMPSRFEAFLNLVHPDDVSRVRSAQLDYIAGRSDFHEAEFRLAARNGQWRWLHTGGIAMKRDESGRVTHMAGVQFDITAHRQAQQAKQTFISMVSHELRTPINAVTGMGKRLMRTPLDERQRDYVTKIDKSAELLLRVINDILDFSKLEVGKMEILHQPFELNDILNRVADVVSVDTEARGLGLRIDLAPNVPRGLIGDGLRLQQILINLASNAVKFTECGEVCISVEARRLDANSAELEFSVRDTGIGIEPDQLQRLFKPFTQVDPFLTRRKSGTGLGLSISQQLVQLMHGRIWADSTPGLGSSFSFALPFELHARSAAAIHRDSGATPLPVLAGLRNLRVLLVEDNAFNQQVIAESLIDAGIVVQTATNGLDALRQVRESLPDLVLMDIQMDVMDGLEATRLIRATSGLEALPIIAMTAHGMIEIREEARAAGLTDFLVKPVEPNDLYATLLRATQSASKSASSFPREAAKRWTGQMIEGLDMDRALRMTRGQFDLLVIRLGQFIDELGDAGERMRDRADAERWLEAEHLAHSLKGAAGNVGAMVLSSYADAFLNTADITSRRELIGRICDQLTRLKKQSEMTTSEPGLSQ